MITKNIPHYVLMTAAKNEENYIGACIQSVLSQTVLPIKWVIISDGSVDATEKIVLHYSQKNPLIKLIRNDFSSDKKGFASKVTALQKGFLDIESMQWQFLGILDADITLDEHYYEKIIIKFLKNPKLGIAGGFIFEKSNDRFLSRLANSPLSVAGGIQMFRRQCHQKIGGIKPMPLGGEDWHAEIKARMHGWEVQAFPEFPAYHHNPSIGKRGFVKEALRAGAMDYSMGTHPVFAMFKSARRIRERPYFLFAFLLLYGYLKAHAMRHPQQAGEDVGCFLRKEQLRRIRTLFLKKGSSD